MKHSGLRFILYGTLVALVMTACSTPAPAAVPTPVPTAVICKKEYREVLEAVWSTIDQTYFDPDFGGLDWDAVHEQYEPLVCAAEDDETLYGLLNRMLWELKVSHAAVGPADAFLSAVPVIWAAGETGLDVRLLDGQAVITRVRAGSPAEEAGLRPGFVIQSIAGTSVKQIIAEMEGHLAPPYNAQGRTENLTRHLLGLIYGDPGTCVTLTYLDDRYSVPPLGGRYSVSPLGGRYSVPPTVSPKATALGGKDGPHEGCVKRVQRSRVAYMGELPPSYLEFESRRLPSGIGYIRFNTFHPDLLPDMAEAVAALQDAPGIIIDLRGNPGGELDTDAQMAAQFLDGQVTFGRIRARSGTTPWVLTGENAYAGPLVILIDALSYSGSEFVASGMQTTGRAVIIGERSPGGALAGNVKLLPNGAVLIHPVKQLLTADGKVVEGYGIIPDVTVSLERSQLLAGIDAQLQAAVDYISGR